MTLLEKVVNFFTGKCLREAQKDLHDSSRWTREQMTELRLKAHLTTLREEKALAETRKVLDELEGRRRD